MLEGGDVGVGVFPEREVGAGETETRKRASGQNFSGCCGGHGVSFRFFSSMRCSNSGSPCRQSRSGSREIQSVSVKPVSTGRPIIVSASCFICRFPYVHAAL